MLINGNKSGSYLIIYGFYSINYLTIGYLFLIYFGVIVVIFFISSFNYLYSYLYVYLNSKSYYINDSQSYY